MSKAQRIGKSVIIGSVSGLAASWVMNQYWAAESKLKERLQPKQGDQARQQQQPSNENPTVKVADSISQSVTGHFYFDNDDSGYAPRNALELKQLVGQLR